MQTVLRPCQELRRQGNLWLKLSHPHVANFYGFVYNFGMLPGLVLEFYEGKSVMEYTKRESSDETKLRLVRNSFISESSNI
jgi:hypothetical protein